MRAARIDIRDHDHRRVGLGDPAVRVRQVGERTHRAGREPLAYEQLDEPRELHRRVEDRHDARRTRSRIGQLRLVHHAFPRTYVDDAVHR